MKEKTLMPVKFCNHPNCTTLIPINCSYCEKHKDLHGFRKNSYDYLYTSPLWKKMRREFLTDNPVCVICGKEATVVDHIRPHRGDENLFYNIGNWQPLCKECHDRKTNREIAERNRRDPY